MADLGETEGTLDETEEAIIHNLLELRNVMVEDEMTPRTVVAAFDMNMTIKQVLDENTILRFSRIPVFEESIDSVRGLVIRSEILMAASRDEWDLQLKDIMKPILKLELGSTIDQALDVFLSNRQQFALVRDEFGGTSGILTMEDVMENLLGKEIVDELDRWKTCENLRENKRLKPKNDVQACATNARSLHPVQLIDGIQSVSILQAVLR